MGRDKNVNREIYVNDNPYYGLNADVIRQYEQLGYFYLVFRIAGETRKVKIYNIQKKKIGDYEMYSNYTYVVIPNRYKEHGKLMIDAEYKYEFDVQEVDCGGNIGR